MLFKNFFGIVLILYFVIYTEGACQINGRGVNDNDKTRIVNLHNNARRRIASGECSGQPKGINLKRMRWDSRLASAAQRIANSCKFDHQKVTDNRWSFVGQNLYTSYSSSPGSGSNWAAALDSWLKESRKYRYPNGFSMTTGHYTQVVWAETNYVGCGFTYFCNNGIYQKLYVCNYGPGGNSGGPPYKTGKSG